ncbi:DDE_3 domain-containing protein [Trichonephila clavipes]|nr:DDE_3 domain-containing protein [Trichonephila clavipes]
MNDNTMPHRALLVDEFLESEDIRHIDRSTRSPDPNPIEPVWNALGNAIATREHPILPENPPGNENRVAERVGSIDTRPPRTDKLP